MPRSAMMRASEAITAEKNTLKDRGKQAVELALSGKWAEAKELNRAIIIDNPDDVEAHNRLGKALTELSDFAGAADAFEKAVSLSPHNSIARKNLDRLATLSASGAARTTPAIGRTAVNAEAGKSGVVPLVNLIGSDAISRRNRSGSDAISRLTPGDTLELVCADRVVKAIGPDGARIGQVEPRVGARIAKLMAAGNRYGAIVRDLDDGGISLLISETYQHPSQIGVVSFPDSRATAQGGPRAGVSGSDRYRPSSALSPEREIEDPESPGLGSLKDWSNDDTEPGDDEVFSPVVHRIINSSGGPDEEF